MCVCKLVCMCIKVCICMISSIYCFIQFIFPFVSCSPNCLDL